VMPEGDGCRPADVDVPSLPVCVGTCAAETPCEYDAQCQQDEECVFDQLGGCCLPDQVCLAIYAPCQGRCAPHGCATEPQLACFCVRPDCANLGVAVIRNGCWVCVDRTTCEPLPAGGGCG
jgi:hypothetical protein